MGETSIVARFLRGASRSVAVLLVCLLAGCALETEYVVNTLTNVGDANPGDGVCAGGGGNVCSLRAAIEETNAHAAGELVRITVPEGEYELGGQALTLTHDSVILRGAGRELTVVRQTGAGSRVLTITSPDDILVEDLTLTGGTLTTSGNGGAVHVDGSSYLVTFGDCRVNGNTAGFFGGGIYAQGSGVLNILNSVLEDNDSTGSGCVTGGGVSGGGAIMANGPTLNLIQSMVRNNCGSNGGGVRVDGGSNHLILRSSISDNGAATRAGGLLAISGTAGRIEDSTIAENSGPESGGALFEGGDFSLINVTIAGNTTVSAGDHTGGILSTNGAVVTLTNTVVANNGGLLGDCSGEFLSNGGNFFGDVDASCTIAAEPSDVVDGGDPGLGALGFNGAETLSMLPNVNSPLVDAGVSGCAPIDQRNRDAPAGEGCDIGAAERQ